MRAFASISPQIGLFWSTAKKHPDLKTQVFDLNVAERVRFELTEAINLAGFQDRCLKPLGHLSKIKFGAI